jgi:hypothetical protein
MSAIEEKKAKYAVSITRLNTEIQKSVEPPAHQIGFVIEDEVDYDDQ